MTQWFPSWLCFSLYDFTKMSPVSWPWVTSPVIFLSPLNLTWGKFAPFRYTLSSEHSWLLPWIIKYSNPGKFKHSKFENTENSKNVKVTRFFSVFVFKKRKRKTTNSKLFKIFLRKNVFCSWNYTVTHTIRNWLYEVENK